MERLSQINHYYKGSYDGSTCEISRQWYDEVKAKLAAYENAEEQGQLEDCDHCRFKLQSESWKYYSYPCNECSHRVKNHFTCAEAALKGAQDEK